MNRRKLNGFLLKSACLGALPIPVSIAALSEDISIVNAGGSTDIEMDQFINDIPKAESHVHLQGCVTPELLLRFAKRNGISLAYRNEKEVESFIENSYGPDLSDFIRLLNEISLVLKTEDDIYDTALDYFKRSSRQNVKYAEVYFDPQPVLDNGLSMPAMMNAMNTARGDAAKEYDIDSKWIMSFHRDRSPQSALSVLALAEHSRENIVGVALDNLDTPNYPERFKGVFDRAHDLGYKRTTHVDVGEQSAIDRVWGAINALGVDGRIDHGIDGLVDERFRSYIKNNEIALAVCPTLFFNKKPRDSAYFREVCDSVRFMLDNDMRVTLNTDDPGIFSLNYAGDIYKLVQKQIHLTHSEVIQLARNSFEMLWMDDARKETYLTMLKPFESRYAGQSTRFPSRPTEGTQWQY